MPFENGTWVDYIACNGTLEDMISCANTNTDNLFMLGIIVALWFILFMGIAYSSKDEILGIAIATFVTTIIAMLFAGIDLLPDEVALAFLLGTIASMFLLYATGRSRRP